MRSTSGKSVLLLSAALLLLGLAGCTSVSAGQPEVGFGELFATARGKVTRINREQTWFEMKPKSGGGLLKIDYDDTTTLLNFKGMIEIGREQPVEVTYLPGGDPANRAVSIRKLQPDECN
jgi:hypothetical protein